jgi:hypothetical protein
MKEEVNRKDKPSIFLKKKGKQWFDDVRSSTSSKDDVNSMQDGDSTISNEEGEILNSEKESNDKTRRKSIRILNIQDFPQQNFEEFHSTKKRKSNSTSSKEQMELEIKRKQKDDKAVGAESEHEELEKSKKQTDETAGVDSAPENTKNWRNYRNKQMKPQGLNLLQQIIKGISKEFRMTNLYRLAFFLKKKTKKKKKEKKKKLQGYLTSKLSPFGHQRHFGK